MNNYLPIAIGTNNNEANTKSSQPDHDTFWNPNLNINKLGFFNCWIAALYALVKPPYDLAAAIMASSVV